VTVTASLIEELVRAVAAELAPRIAAEFESAVPSERDGESWRLLDVDETARKLGRSTRWVRDRAKRGELPFIRLDGGPLAFDLDDVRAFASARRVPDDGA
jgi:hypothetical protein